jgi:hypothetical protein
VAIVGAKWAWTGSALSVTANLQVGRFGCYTWGKKDVLLPSPTPTNIYKSVALYTMSGWAAESYLAYSAYMKFRLLGPRLCKSGRMPVP